LPALAFGTGCARARPAPEAADASGGAPLALQVSGCVAVAADGSCTFDDEGAIRVLVPGTAPATFTTPAGPLAADALATFDDARLYGLHVPLGADRVRVVAGNGEGHVDVKRSATPAWRMAADAREEHKDYDGALAIYAEHRASSDAGEAALAAGRAARLELNRGRLDASAVLFGEAIAKDRAAGRASDAVDDSMALAFALGERGHRYAAARATLDGVADLLDRYPDGQARAPYYRAMMDSDAGDHRAALAGFREAARHTTRLGLARLGQMVQGSVATELDLLGRFDEALAIRREIAAAIGPEAPPCKLVTVRTGMGFGLLLKVMRDADEGAKQPGPEVREAVGLLESARDQTGCDDDYLRGVALGNLALAALLDGRPTDAAAALARARALVSEPPASQGFFWLDLDGRIALARHDARAALRVYDEMRERARAAVLPEHEWRAWTGRGAALEALGKPRDAIDAYERAEQELDGAGLAIPIGEGRARFLVERERSATAAIALLVARGDHDGALRWARRSRRRVLAGLAALRGPRDPADRARRDAALDAYLRERAAIDDEARLDWKLPVADLARARARRGDREAALRRALEQLLSVPAGAGAAAAPSSPLAGPGQLGLLLHRAPEGWTGMAVDDAGVFVFAVPPFDPGGAPAEIARVVLGPIRDRIERASRLRLLLPGDLAPLDVHALPSSDAASAPLVERLPVEYVTDLGDRPADPPKGGARALVVGDPQGSLPGARREARGVATVLGDLDAGAVDLLQTRQATHAAVMSGLADASFFHYAGHATYAGEDGWDSALPLADGGRLLVTDVLALPRAPSRVIVSGCSAGRTSADAPGETLGIAQAFLVAGSDAVVAPARDVDDDLSARFVDLLYGELRGDPSLDLARAVRRAQLALRASDPDGDWAAFRVLRR
jgi:tetratricopeptide (TPR) repeat protein